MVYNHLYKLPMTLELGKVAHNTVEDSRVSLSSSTGLLSTTLFIITVLPSSWAMMVINYSIF